ncbi:hypothetical protein ME3_00038 [Bartonella melophagi K-2C]|uniref:Uncharacterized protein n=1 Tax=Bartonella melophagi K-2C TaxID=1094557 RepID=J1K3T6_9HYPH|nr:hypothetical protein ME3_00038 [Bartonella melophagi K-2C]
MVHIKVKMVDRYKVEQVKSCNKDVVNFLYDTKILRAFSDIVAKFMKI